MEGKDGKYEQRISHISDNLQVTVSGIVARNDQWNKKVYEVNKVLSNLCKDVHILFISHSVIDAKRNLNNSKLHLKIRGSRKLQENFVKYLKDFSSWDNVTRNKCESCDGLSTKSKEYLYTANCERFLKEPQLSTSNEDICFGQHLNNLRRRNIGRLILAHISINSIRCKFGQLVHGVKTKVDVLMITETKLDDSFPTMQFNIERYHTFRLDRNQYGVGILLYVRDDIPTKFIPIKNSTIEGFFIELNLRKKKWLLCCTYNANRSFISVYLSTIWNNINLL